MEVYSVSSWICGEDHMELPLRTRLQSWRSAAACLNCHHCASNLEGVKSRVWEAGRTHLTSDPSFPYVEALGFIMT